MRSDDAPVLSLRNARAGYGRHDILTGLNLDVRPGRTLALVGPNGAGKSTTARAACGLLRLRGGSRVYRSRHADGREHVALAPQQPALPARLTVVEVFRLFAGLSDLPRPEIAAAVEAAVAGADAHAQRDTRIHALSGGWQRRVSLAAALIGSPDLLVLDEPTEGVDAATRLRLAETVKASARAGAAILLISHDGAFVDLVADDLAIMADGAVTRVAPGGVLVRETYGDAHLVIVRLTATPDAATAAWLAGQGLKAAEAGLEWSGLFDDGMARAARLAEALEVHGAEVRLRRPRLSDLISGGSEPG